MVNFKKTLFFYILLILVLISAILTWINYSGHLKYNLVNVIIETKLDKQDDIVLKVNDNHYLFTQFNDVLNITIKEKIKNLELLINKNHKNPIKSIVLFNDTDMEYYSDFSSFEKTSIDNYDKYKFKNEIKQYNSEIDLSIKGVEAFFRGKIIFLFSYILLFISILYFINNKQEIYFNFNQKTFFIIALLFAILFRLNNISYYPPWWDEIYSINTTLANADFVKIFQDPGNPWFYYLILKIFNVIFQTDFIGMKILSVIIGLICNVLIYLFLKQHHNIKSANIAFILAAINLPLICYSQEIRCYILQACYIVAFAYLIFNILKEDKKKYYILYFILLVCAINTHYYQILLMISNFIFLGFFFIKEKKYKSLLNFTLLNFTAFLTFLPYFFYCAYNKALLNSSFNAHLPELSSQLIIDNILFIFGGLISLVLFFILFIKYYKNQKIVIYSIYTICSVFVLALIFSLLIRPMFIQKYLIFLMPLQIILLSIIISPIKNKLLIILSILWIFQIKNSTDFNLADFKKKCLIDKNVLKIASEYKKTTRKNVNVIIKRKGYDFDYLYSKDINYFNIDKVKKTEDYKKETLELIKEIKSKDKNAIIFTSVFIPNNIKYTCFFNSSQDMCIYKIK